MTSLINIKIVYYIIPFLIGLFTSYSLPPYSLFFINFITFPILLFFILSNQKKAKWQSFKIGWMFGFGYFVSNLYWITKSLTFEDIFKPLIPLALIVIPLFLGLFYGFVTLFSSYCNLKKKISSIFIFAIFFSLIEYLRSFIFGGFPWNLIAYSFTDYLEFLQITSFIGTYAFNLLCVTIFLAPSIFFFNYQRKNKLFFLFFIIFILVINFIYGSFSIKKYEKIEKTNLDFVIKVVSPKIDIKRFFENEETENVILDLVNLSKPNKLKNTLFIFPEGIIPNIYLQDIKNYSYLFLKNFSDKHKIILGIKSYEKSQIFNSFVVLDNNLNTLAKYNKNKLVPFGEYLPFENTLNKIGFKKITQGYQSFSSDNERKIISINNINFLPLICYEIIYSGKINNENQSFDFIINISEDGWFGDSIGPHQHFSHSIFRSVEEGKNLFRSANSGISAHINPKGQIINSIKSTDKGVLEVKSFKKIEKTIFNIFGNNIFFCFLIFYISFIFFLRKKENR